MLNTINNALHVTVTMKMRVDLGRTNTTTFITMKTRVAPDDYGIDAGGTSCPWLIPVMTTMLGGGWANTAHIR